MTVNVSVYEGIICASTEFVELTFEVSTRTLYVNGCFREHGYATFKKYLKFIGAYDFNMKKAS